MTLSIPPIMSEAVIRGSTIKSNCSHQRWGGEHDVTHLAAHLLLFLGGPGCHDLGSIGTSGEVGEEPSADIVLFPYQRCWDSIARGGLTCAR